MEPEVLGYTEQALHVDGAEVLCVEIALSRDVSKWGFSVAWLVVTAAEDPVEYAGVLTETRPEEFALEKEIKLVKCQVGTEVWIVDTYCRIAILCIKVVLF